MARWIPRLETRLYRPIAWLAGRALARLPYVRSVYARRSFACGEVVFGASDIDLHVVVDESPDVATEGARLTQLAGTTRRLKRVLLPLGQYDVTTRGELDDWYTARPYTFYRDRGWTLLAGEEVTRPVCALRDDGARNSLLWWLFQAFELLPAYYRSGDVRTCSNVFLDVVNAAAVHTDELAAPTSRRAVLAHWRAMHPQAPAALARGFRHAYRGGFRHLRGALYAETLRAIDALARRIDPSRDAGSLPAELASVDVFRDRALRYLLVDPERAASVGTALAVLDRDPRTVVTTAAGLGAYLRHRNPWEAAALVIQNPKARIPAVDDADRRRAARLLAHRLVARRAGLSIGRRHDYGASTVRQLAQARLYLESGVVAVDAAGLEREYARHFGTWPFVRATSAEEFFQGNYQPLCDVVDRLAVR